MKTIEFRQISKNDICILEKYNHWSRYYEYPIVNQFLQKNLLKNSKIHNTSWGWEPPNHTEFKNDLENFFGEKNITNSDINSSNYPNTTVWDILSPPKEEWIEYFDAVLNISTLEEVDSDHIKCFNNLYSQVKLGGYFIITFDLPGLQLEKFEELLNQKFIYSSDPISGLGLTFGILIIQK